MMQLVVVEGKDLVIDPVTVIVTDTQVRFASSHKEIVLSKEERECIIWDAEDSYFVQLLYNIPVMTSFLGASRQTDRVWLLLSDTSPAMLNFPNTLGHIKYYFVSE
ncbi:hypothetical protein CFOL_v3_35418 [Cephalotus follicularis]|uniref:Uncharacterized protein n=1 Tax=Cephalotus follicularis TaxID=3775 RepID=A0A1Q3DHS2_CEPFO|nr:hypothetical protein CFOL_v3_35418 [Cephalotus follicularis]